MQEDKLAELNIITYNSFQDVLFWDVLQALSKVYTIRMKMMHHEMLGQSDGLNIEALSMIAEFPSRFHH